MKQSLPPQVARVLRTAVEDWTHTGKTQRLWNYDKSLWTGADEDKWPGWLHIADRQLAQRKRFEDLAAQIKNQAYSLCPEVLSLMFGRADRFPALNILDSTDAAW
jgi:transaldolase/glucose-6-phosphate isomerase